MIEQYLARLARELDGCGDRDRIVEEARDHLEEAIAAERARGASEHQAARHAIARFGSPREVAKGFVPAEGPLRRLRGLVRRKTMAEGTKPKTAYSCSFCGKPQERVRRLIAGPGFVFICNECVALCNQIIGEEEGQPQAAPT